MLHEPSYLCTATHKNTIMVSCEDFKRIIELYKPQADMERQDFINTIKELKSMINSLKLTIGTLSSSDDKFAERYDSVVAEVKG